MIEWTKRAQRSKLKIEKYVKNSNVLIAIYFIINRCWNDILSVCWCSNKLQLEWKIRNEQQQQQQFSF